MSGHLRGDRTLGILGTYSGTLRQQALEGRWVSAEGIVFSSLQVDVHLVERFPIPAHWTKFRSIDFGMSHPFVCQWWAVDEQNRMWLYREIYKSNVHIEEHARNILELSQGEEILYTVVDYEAASDIETLHRHGIWTDPADKDKVYGIQLMHERFKVDPVTKETSIYFLVNSLVEEDEKLAQRYHPKCTFESLINLTYRESKTGSKLDEEPMKVHDDGFDATRYAIVSQDSGKLVGRRIHAKSASVPTGADPDKRKGTSRGKERVKRRSRGK